MSSLVRRIERAGFFARPRQAAAASCTVSSSASYIINIEKSNSSRRTPRTSVTDPASSILADQRLQEPALFPMMLPGLGIPACVRH